jgi:pimeloyl-ACP methyl ester carboxylesterase
VSDRKPIWPRIRRIWITAGLVFTAGFAGWSLLAFRATAEARRVLAGDARVRVTPHEDHWLFTPRSAPEPVGLLFFAGALVDPAAYAPLTRDVAAEGFPAVLVKLPRRAAFGGADGGEVLSRARAAMKGVPAISSWVVAGHSRGAVVAARMVRDGGPGVGGLVIVGSTHPRDFSLAGLTVPVTKILGTKDCVADLDKSERNRHLLPPSTRWVVLEGANHSQFGEYGFQPGDCFARMTRDEQRRRTKEALVDALLHAAP